MMFNGLLCGDSDGSDLTKGSGGSSRRGTCEDVEYYREKLRATTLILRNKEETVRVQNESLMVAAARLDALTTRVTQLQRDLDRRTQELLQLRQSADGESQVKIDTSAEALAQENEKQRKMVRALGSNLSVIQEMYRECFYEAAQQESLIESLREALHELRQADGDRTGTLRRLRDIVDSQRSEIRRCQDIAMDVENLKSEILSFLNSSNNDSGVWEEASGEDAGEELRDIAAQLRRLQTLLQEDCSCTGRLETQKLKEQNVTLQRETRELKARLADAQTTLSAKDNRLRDLREQLAAIEEQEVSTCTGQLETQNATLEKQVRELRARLADTETSLSVNDNRLCEQRERLADKEKELQEARQKLSAAEAVAQALQADHKEQCHCLQSQLANTQGLLEDRTEDLERARRQCEELEGTLHDVRGELRQVQALLKEFQSSREAEALGCCRCTELQTELDETKALLARKTCECEELLQDSRHSQGLMCQLQNLNSRGSLDTEAQGCCRCEDLQKQLDETKALLANKTCECRELKQDSSHLVMNSRGSLDADAKGFCRCTELQTELDETKALLVSKTCECRELKQECSHLQGLVSQLQGMNSRGSLDTDAKGFCRCTELQTELDETYALLASRSCECRAHESTIRELKQDVSHLQGLVCQLQSLKQKREGSASQLSAMQCCSLQERLDEATALLSTRTGELAATQLKCGALRAEMEALRADLARAQRTNDKLQDTERLLTSQHGAALADERRASDLLRAQLDDAHQQLECQRRELRECEAQRRQLEESVAQLNEEIAQANRIIKSDAKVRSEVSYLSQQVALWRQQLGESAGRVQQLEDELATARRHARELDDYCSGQTAAARALEAELCAATSRGAELCAESRRVLCAVRGWLRAQHTEYQKKLREQEQYAAQLAARLQQHELRAACSTRALPPAAPLPPRRTKPHRCRCRPARAPAAPHAERAACCQPDQHTPSPPLPESPTEVLFSRVEALQRAILAGQRCWLGRAPPPPPPPPNT